MNNQNPFLSDNFKSIWLKHFNTKNSSIKSFKYISDLEFIKHGNSSIYVNLGENLTKGISYSVNPAEDAGLNNQMLLIFDVPTYFKVDTTQLGNKIKLLKSKQYPGFLIETSKYTSLNEYMLSNFNRNSRNKNNKYKRRLESSFDISCKMFFGEISKVEYDFVFTEFKLLLEKRYADKQVTNHNLQPDEWSFYNEVAYQLILEKKASLYVIYNKKQPIGVTLSYFSSDTLFDAMTVFDIDYSKFHLGSVTIMKLIEWCIKNDIKTLDLSKGYFEYKKRWCTKIYNFEYHIYYDSTSIKSRILASSIKQKYDLKQKLREKKLNERLHKLTHKLKSKESRATERMTFTFYEANKGNAVMTLIPINLEAKNNNNSIKLLLFEFLYLYEENYNDIKLFQLNNDNNSYLIEGKKKSICATVSCK